MSVQGLTKDEQIALLMELNEAKSQIIEDLEIENAEKEDIIIELEDELVEFDGIVSELSGIIETLVEACEDKGVKVVFYGDDGDFIDDEFEFDDECDCPDCVEHRRYFGYKN